MIAPLTALTIRAKSDELTWPSIHAESNTIGQEAANPSSFVLGLPSFVCLTGIEGWVRRWRAFRILEPYMPGGRRFRRS